MREHDSRLAIYGSDFSRWPDGTNSAREALLREPEFRRAWEIERNLDRKLAAHRDALDTEIARSGAMTRLARLATRPASAALAGGIPWRRVAAGVLVAGLLGGALDLMLPQPAPEPLEMALVDPLAGFDLAGNR